MASSKGVPSSRRPEARGVHGWFLSVTPLLVLGLAIFVVALNVRCSEKPTRFHAPDFDLGKRVAVAVGLLALLYRRTVECLESLFVLPVTNCVCLG